MNDSRETTETNVPTGDKKSWNAPQARVVTVPGVTENNVASIGADGNGCS
ncbi:MAG TPA: hypothetical protein VNU97_13855 [Rhizomicrobium sp.]|jgi:hypothetical protein|nr:hypothetical protein [Rhizomicrobium sp.]